MTAVRLDQLYVELDTLTPVARPDEAVEYGERAGSPDAGGAQAAIRHGSGHAGSAAGAAGRSGQRQEHLRQAAGGLAD